MNTHLTGFGLENFRVFKDYTWFDFAPITILTGPNNSGKSSLIKALLLLKDNFDQGLLPPKFEFLHDWQTDGTVYRSDQIVEAEYGEEFKPKKLIFDGNVHGLNSPTSTKSWNKEKNEMCFEIPFEVNKTLLLYKIAVKIDSATDAANPTNKIEIVESSQSQKKILLRIEPYSIFFDIEFYNQIVSIRNQVPNIPKEYDNQVYSNLGISFQYWFSENKFEEDSKILAEKVLQIMGISEKFDGSFSCKAVTGHFNSLDFWASSQSEQKRIYTESDSSKFKQLLVDFHKASQNLEVQNIFEGYAEHFGIKGKIGSLFNQEQGSYFPNIDGLALTNFGYGYTQLISLFFKLMIHAHKNREKYKGDTFDHHSTLMLEEPEINLHPNLQSKLADLFKAISAQTNTQFLIETHSEYMIRKFQYLTAKKEIASADTVIYYFHDPNNVPAGEPQVKKIEILEDGSLSSDFGAGFFDEATNWKFELMRLKNAQKN
jgi:AAA15 family ATPase/GTPase